MKKNELYSKLLEDGFAVGEYKDFESKLLDDANSKKLHSNLIKWDYEDISSDYDVFKSSLLPEPEKPSLLNRIKDVGTAVKDGAKKILVGEGGTKAETLNKPLKKTLNKPTKQPVIPEEKVDPQVGHTVGSWLNKYAPATDSSGQDNNQSNYLEVIKGITGADPQTPLNQVNIDSLAQAVAKQEGYYQSPEWNLENTGRETNLSQEWNNMGMLEFRGQEGAMPSREVLDKKGNVLYPEGRFAVFATEEEGFNALKRQLSKDQSTIFPNPTEDGLDISFKIARNNSLPNGHPLKRDSLEMLKENKLQMRSLADERVLSAEDPIEALDQEEARNKEISKIEKSNLSASAKSELKKKVESKPINTRFGYEIGNEITGLTTKKEFDYTLDDYNEVAKKDTLRTELDNLIIDYGKADKKRLSKESTIDEIDDLYAPNIKDPDLYARQNREVRGLDGSRLTDTQGRADNFGKKIKELANEDYEETFAVQKEIAENLNSNVKELEGIYENLADRKERPENVDPLVMEELNKRGSLIDGHYFYDKASQNIITDPELAKALNDPEDKFNEEFDRPAHLLKINAETHEIADEDMLTSSNFGSKYVKNPISEISKSVPFAQGANAVREIGKIALIIKRLDDGKWIPDEDKIFLRDYNDRILREATIGNMSLNGVQALPAFILEMYTTGGFYTAGKKITTKGLKLSIEKFFKKEGQSKLRESLAESGLLWGGRLGGVAVQATLARPFNIVAGTIREITSEYEVIEGLNADRKKFLFTKKVADGEKIGRATYNSFMDNYIEFISERSGRSLSKFGGAIKNKMFKEAVEKSVLKVNKDLPPSYLSKLLKDANVGGFKEEYSEERLGQLLRSLAGIEELRMPTYEEFISELIVLSVPSGARSVAGTYDTRKARKEFYKNKKFKDHYEALKDIESFGETEINKLKIQLEIAKENNDLEALYGVLDDLAKHQTSIPTKVEKKQIGKGDSKSYLITIKDQYGNSLQTRQIFDSNEADIFLEQSIKRTEELNEKHRESSEAQLEILKEEYSDIGWTPFVKIKTTEIPEGFDSSDASIREKEPNERIEAGKAIQARISDIDNNIKTINDLQSQNDEESVKLINEYERMLTLGKNTLKEAEEFAKEVYESPAGKLRKKTKEEIKEIAKNDYERGQRNKKSFKENPIEYVKNRLQDRYKYLSQESEIDAESSKIFKELSEEEEAVLKALEKNPRIQELGIQELEADLNELTEMRTRAVDDLNKLNDTPKKIKNKKLAKKQTEPDVVEQEETKIEEDKFYLDPETTEELKSTFTQDDLIETISPFLKGGVYSGENIANEISSLDEEQISNELKFLYNVFKDDESIRLEDTRRNLGNGEFSSYGEVKPLSSKAYQKRIQKQEEVNLKYIEDKNKEDQETKRREEIDAQLGTQEDLISDSEVVKKPNFKKAIEEVEKPDSLKSFIEGLETKRNSALTKKAQPNIIRIIETVDPQLTKKAYERIDFINKNADKTKKELTGNIIVAERLISRVVLNLELIAKYKYNLDINKKGFTQERIDEGIAKFNELMKGDVNAERDLYTGRIVGAEQEEVVETEKISTEPINKKDSDLKIYNVPIDNLNVDLSLFQNRTKEFNEEKVQEIESSFDERKLDPIDVWINPKDGKSYIIEGHSRAEALKRLGKKTANIRYYDGTLEDAIDYAETKNDSKATHSLIEKSKILKSRVERDSLNKSQKVKEAKKLYGKDANTIIALSTLNPKGNAILTLDAFSETDEVSMQDVVTMAKWVGEIRNKNNKLTDSHENEIFENLKDNFRKSEKYKSSLSFQAHIDSAINRNTFMGELDSSKPLNLKKLRSLSPTEVLYNEDLKKAERDLLDAKRKLDSARTQAIATKKDKDENVSTEDLETILRKENKDVAYFEKELLDLKQREGLVNKQAKSEIGLFDQIDNIKEELNSKGVSNEEIIQKQDTDTGDVESLEEPEEVAEGNKEKEIIDLSLEERLKEVLTEDQLLSIDDAPINQKTGLPVKEFQIDLKKPMTVKQVVSRINKLSKYIGLREDSYEPDYDLIYDAEQGVSKAQELLLNDYNLYYDEFTKTLSDNNSISEDDPKIKFQLSAFHGSPHNFNQFTTKALGSGVGGQAFGWGLYFTNTEDVAKHYASTTTLQKDGIEINTGSEHNLIKGRRNLYKVSLHKGKKVEDYDYIWHSRELTREQDQKVKNYLDTIDPAIYEYINRDGRYFNADGGGFYRELQKWIGSNRTKLNKVFGDPKIWNRTDELASLMLLEAGIDGIKFIAGGVGSPATGTTNYVVFDENAITLEQHIKFQLGIFKDAKKQSKENERSDNKKSLKKKTLPYIGITKENARESISQLEKDFKSELGVNKAELKLGDVKDNPDFKATAELAKTLGQRVMFIEANNVGDFGFNALTNRGKIFINTDKKSDHSSFYSFGHELTHKIETESPELFDKLWDVIHEESIDINGILYQYAKKYPELGRNPDELFKEFIGDVMGDAMQDRMFWAKVYQKSPELFKKMVDLINKILKSLKFNKSYEVREFIKDMDRVIEVSSSVLAEYGNKKKKFNKRIPVDMFYPSTSKSLSFQKGIDSNDLYAIHNVTGSNIVFADKMKGFANPSIAIVNKDDEFNSFGDISLLANKDIVDPKKGAKTFGADIYSPRYPEMRQDFSKGEAKRFLNNLIRASKKLNIKYEDYLSEESKFLDDISRGYNDDPRAIALFIVNNRLISKYKKYIKDNPIDAKQDSYWEKRDETNRIRNFIYKTEGLNQKKNEYLRSYVERFGVDKKIFKGYTQLGYRKYVPYTLDNVLKVMKKNIRGGEGFSYGMGSVRASYTPQFKNLKDIRNNKDRLVSKENFEKNKKPLEDKFFEIGEELKPYYKYSTDGFGYMDNFSESLRDLAKGYPFEHDFKEVPQKVKENTYSFLDELRKMPTEYFESKPQRIVRLSEFSKAIVRDTTPKNVLDILKKNGVEIIKYNEGELKNVNRKNARNSASELRFQKRLDWKIPFKSKGTDTIGRDIPDWRGMEVYHSTDDIGFDSITKDGYKIVGEGYYGEAISFTPQYGYTIQFGNKLTKARISKTAKILNLNDAKDSEIDRRIMKGLPTWDYHKAYLKAGYDGLYDAGAGDLFIFNPKVLSVVPVEDYMKPYFDTKEFQNWFKDSVVYDRYTLDPIEVYHATDKEFDVFDYKKTADGGFWFTNNKKAITDPDVHLGNAGSGVIIPAFLSIKKPARWSDYESKSIGELINEGFDGVVLEDGVSTNYIVFEPTQIKSSISNKGTFDSSNPNIKFQKRADNKPSFVNEMSQRYYELGTKLSDKGNNIKPSKADFIKYLNEQEFNKTEVKRASMLFNQIKNNAPKVSQDQLDVEKKISNLEEKVEKGSKKLEVKGLTSLEKRNIKEGVKQLKKDIKNIISGSSIGSRDQTKNLVAVKKDIRTYAQENLPSQLTRGQIKPLLTLLEKAKTIDDIQKGISRVDTIAETVNRKTLSNRIKDLLKKTRPVKNKNGNTVSRYKDARKQDFLDEIFSYSELNALDAQKKIAYKNTLIAEEKDYDKDGKEIELTEERREKIEEDLFLLELFTNIESKSVMELQDTFQNLKEIIKTAKSNRARRVKEQRDIDKNVRRQVLKTITGSKRVIKTSVSRRDGSYTDDTIFLNKIINNFKGANAFIQSWETLLDILSFKDKGSSAFDSYLNRKFGKELREADLSEQQGILEREQALTSAVRKIYGLKSKELNPNSEILARRRVGNILKKNEEQKVVDIDIPIDLMNINPRMNLLQTKRKGKFSQNELAQYWMWWQDETLRPTFDRMGWTQDTIDQLEKVLDPKVKQFAEYLLNEFYPNYYNSVNKVYRDVFHVNMPFNPKYSHVSRETFGTDPKLIKEGETLESRTGFASNTSSHLIARVKSKKTLQPTDMLSNVYNHINQMEHFKSHAKPVRNIRATFNNSEVAKAIELEQGKEFVIQLNKMIDRIARGGADPMLKNVYLDLIINQFVKAKIGLKPVIFLKQLASFPAFASEMPIVDWLKYSRTIMGSPNIPITKSSRLYKSRGKGYSRDLKALLNKSSSQKLIDRKNYKDAFMSLARAGDRMAILWGGKPIYYYYYDRHLAKYGDKEKANLYALEKFEASAEKWQQSAQTKNLSNAQQAGSFFKLFTMFLNTPIQYWQQGTTGLRNLIGGRGKKSENIKRVVMSYIVLQATFNVISTAFKEGLDDDDDKMLSFGFLEKLLYASFRGVPIVGGVANWLRFRLFNHQLSALESVLPEATQAYDAGASIMESYSDGKFDLTSGEWHRYLKPILDIVGTGFGVPFEGVGEIYLGMREAQADVAINPVLRAIGYSEYALYGGKNNRVSYVIKDNIENNKGEKELKEDLQKWYVFDGVKKDKISSKIKLDIKNYRIRKEFGYLNTYVNQLLDKGIDNKDKAKILKEANEKLSEDDFKKLKTRGSRRKLITKDVFKKYRALNKKYN